MSTSVTNPALIPNEVIEHKITDILQTNLDVRSLFKVDTTLAESAGMKKRIYKYTYSGSVEKLNKGAKNTTKGSATLVYDDYEVARYQQTFSYNDQDFMIDPNIVDVYANGAAVEMTNELRGEYFTELAKISNSHETKGASIYDAVVDAVAGLEGAGDKDTEGLFIIMGADTRAAVRKDPLFEASKQGDILYTGQFGTISGIPCVFSNKVPAKTAYLTEQNAITLFVKKEGTVEQARDVESKDNTVVYERYGLVALTDDTRSCIIKVTAAGAGAGAGA